MHCVLVTGDVDKPFFFRKSSFQVLPQHEVSCALQCAGNRRHTMRTLLKEVDGLDWGDGAVMNCRWRGPLLRDVLNITTVRVDDPSTAHVAFECRATECQDDDYYGGSIPLERAMRADAEVIVALEVLSLFL